MTRPTALAAPVEEGVMLLRMERPGVHSLLLGSGGVDGGHERLLNAELVVDDLGKGR